MDPTKTREVALQIIEDCMGLSNAANVRAVVSRLDEYEDMVRLECRQVETLLHEQLVKLQSDLSVSEIVRREYESGEKFTSMMRTIKELTERVAELEGSGGILPRGVDR